MSELTYKKIIDVETVEALNDGATVFVNDGGAMKQVDADKFGAVKTVNGVEPDENGDIEINRSNPVPFNKSGNTVKCVIPFVKAKEMINKGTNQATVTLSITSHDMSTMTIVTETKYASRVSAGVDLSTGEIRWIQADFEMDDGSVIRLQLNPDESVTETIIKPESDTVKTVNGVIPDENGDVVVKTPRECLFVDASAMVPGLVQSFWSVEAIISGYREAKGTITFGLEVVDATTQKNGPTISHTASDIETITDDAENTGYKIIIWFGDDHAPIIVNGLTNTITLDPDWVAPEANITESEVNALIDAKLGVIENGTY